MANRHSSERISRYLDTLRRVDELYQEVSKARKMVTINYSLLVDTYNLFRNAQDGLAPLFKDYNARNSSRTKLLRPSAAEYAKFAELFLRHVQDRYERLALVEYPNSVSEHTIRTQIRELLEGRLSPAEIPDAPLILSFKDSTHLFGAQFDKSYLLAKIEEHERRAWRTRSSDEIEQLSALKRRVIEEDVIDLGYGAKNYSFYNDFLAALQDPKSPARPRGFYKVYIQNGKFKQHTEKAVDTSLTVKAISLAYEQPQTVQIFCIADTDYVPVFETLEHLGVHYIVVYVGSVTRLPPEFDELYSAGKLISIDFKEMCHDVVTAYVELFMNGGDEFYSGENSELYRSYAKAQWDRMNEEWSNALAEREQEEWERFAFEMFSQIDPKEPH